MASLADNQNTENTSCRKKKQDNRPFFEKLNDLIKFKDKPKARGAEQSMYNFITNIMTDSPGKAKGTKVPSNHEDPVAVNKEFEKYIGCTKREIMEDIYNIKGWKQRRISKSSNKFNKNEIKKQIDECNTKEIEAFKAGNSKEASKWLAKKVKLKEQLKNNESESEKRLEEMIKEYDNATDKRRKELQDEMDRLLSGKLVKKHNRIVYLGRLKFPEAKSMEEKLEAQLWENHRLRIGESGETIKRDKCGKREVKEKLLCDNTNDHNRVYIDSIPKHAVYQIEIAFEMDDGFEGKKGDMIIHKKLLEKYGRDYVRPIGGDWFSFPNTTFEKSIEMFKECSREFAKNGKFYTFDELKKLNL